MRDAGPARLFEYVSLGASSNQVTGIDSPVTLTFEVWYDLPSLRKEAVITLGFRFLDDDDATFQRTFDVTVAP
jgi:hypothetical protein